MRLFIEEDFEDKQYSIDNILEWLQDAGSKEVRKIIDFFGKGIILADDTESFLQTQSAATLAEFEKEVGIDFDSVFARLDRDGYLESKHNAATKKPLVKEILSQNLELYLQDFAQEYGGIDYNDISDLSKCWDKIENATKSRIRKFVSELRKACKETGLDAYELSQEYPEDKENCEQLVKHIKSAIKGCKKESFVKEGFGIEDAPGLYKRVYKIIRDNHINADIVDTDDSEDYGFVELDVDGDWKHDHLRLKYLLNQEFDTVIWREKENFPSDDDCFRAIYMVYLADPKGNSYTENVKKSMNKKVRR